MEALWIFRVRAPVPRNTAGASSTASGTRTETETETVSSPPASPQINPNNHPSTDIARIDALLQKIWAAYRQFDYAAVTLLRNEMTAIPGAFPHQRATADIIAAAAYYVLDDTACMRRCLTFAIDQDASVLPNQDAFPSAVCQMHSELLRERK